MHPQRAEAICRSMVPAPVKPIGYIDRHSKQGSCCDVQVMLICVALQVALQVENSERSARLVKARLERTLLGQVPSSSCPCLCHSLLAWNCLFNH